MRKKEMKDNLEVTTLTSGVRNKTTWGRHLAQQLGAA